MKCLIDTHVFLWFVLDSKQLSDTASKLIQNSDNHIYISVASLWEMAIKNSLGKLELPTTYAEFIPEQALKNDISILPIGTSHLHQVADLKFHHRDPFDRLIIAQSMVENIPVITKDEHFGKYPIKIIWDEKTESDQSNVNE